MAWDFNLAQVIETGIISLCDEPGQANGADLNRFVGWVLIEGLRLRGRKCRRRHRMNVAGKRGSGISAG